MALPVSFFQQRINDNTVKPNGTPESTTWEVPVVTLTAANYVAQKAKIDTLEAAVDAFIIGNVAQDTVVMLRDLQSVVASADPLAQRENKLMLTYEDGTTHKKFRVSIGTFDLTKLIGHSENIDLSTGIGADLKTAFEAVVVSPDNSSNGVLLLSGQFVGRNT